RRPRPAEDRSVGRQAGAEDEMTRKGGRDGKAERAAQPRHSSPFTVPPISVPMLAPIPHQIEAEWNPDFAHLVGFPLNLMYARISAAEGGELPMTCTYWFDPGTYDESEEHRAMSYFPEHDSPYWVRVSFDKRTARWRTVKHREETEVCI